MAAIVFRTAFLLALLLPAGAHAAHSDWTDAEASQLRLLLAGPADGPAAGGVEIMLDPGWYTYWRNPGETGVPPVFDFSGSENVAKVEVSYPAPLRHDDGTSVSLVYVDEVVFPLAITPQDPAKPFTLRLAASFGVCSDVCVPTGATAEVASSAASDPLSAARLASFAPRVPKPPVPGRFDVEAVHPEAGALTIDVRMPDSTYSDLFADPPAGWYIGQPSLLERADGVSRYRLSLAGRPEGASVDGEVFRFVAVSGGEAIEKAVTVP